MLLVKDTCTLIVTLFVKNPCALIAALLVKHLCTMVAPTVDSHGKVTTDEMHKQMGEWFNKCVQHRHCCPHAVFYELASVAV